MKHLTSPAFWAAYHQLPEEVQRQADRRYELLKSNPHHPSLQFKRIGRIWSARVGLSYRALGADCDGDIVWFWIGSHATYDRLIQG